MSMLQFWNARQNLRKLMFQPGQLIMYGNRTGVGAWPPEQTYLLDARFDKYVGDTTLTLTDGDELHDDYPDNGVGIIRKGSLVFSDPAGRGGLLSNGELTHGVGAAGETKLMQLGSEPVVSGLSCKMRGNASARDNSVRLRGPGGIGNTGGIITARIGNVRVADSTAVSIDIPVTDIPIGNYREYITVLGAYDSSGKPDPSGTHGALVFYEGRLFYSWDTALGTDLAVEARCDPADGTVSWTVDSLQTYIDTAPLATPQRALFEVDTPDIDDYAPEDGVQFTTVLGSMAVSGGHANNIATATLCAAVYRNINGGYWENSVYSSHSSRYSGQILRYADSQNYWYAYIRADVGDTVYEFSLVEVVNGVPANRIVFTATTLPKSTETRMIVIDDGETITVIFPSSGDIFAHSSTAGAEHKDIVGPLVQSGAEGQGRLYWHVARTGTVQEFTP